MAEKKKIIWKNFPSRKNKVMLSTYINKDKKKYLMMILASKEKTLTTWVEEKVDDEIETFKGN